MAAFFHPRSNLIARGIVAAVVLAPVVAAVAAYTYTRSSYQSGAGLVVPQPVPFSHQHHTSGLGIHCKYCHPTAADSAFAGMPTTDTCMNCHSQIWTEAPILAPVRESWRKGIPIQWNRVHDLPDFTFFNHSVHVRAGVGCYTCHGRVDQMPLVYQVETLFMQWCLECHENPARFLRPPEEIYSMTYRTPRREPENAAELLERHGVRTEGLTDCTACHR